MVPNKDHKMDWQKENYNDSQFNRLFIYYE